MLKCYDRRGGRNRCYILFQPFQLDTVNASIIPKIFEFNTVQSNKMNAPIIKGIIIRPQVMMVHLSSIERVLLTYQAKDAFLFRIFHDYRAHTKQALSFF